MRSSSFHSLSAVLTLLATPILFSTAHPSLPIAIRDVASSSIANVLVPVSTSGTGSTVNVTSVAGASAASATSTMTAHTSSSSGANATTSSGYGGNSTASNTTAAQGVSANGKSMHGSFCIPQFCVNATYDGTSTMTYSISGDAATLSGYAAIGTGSMMEGSNIFVVWSNGCEVVLSQRSSTGHTAPSVNSVADTTAQLVPHLTSTNSSGFLSTFTYPMAASEFSSMMPMIWAYDSKPPTMPSNSSSKISYHTNYGAVTLQLSTSAAGGTTTKTAKQKSITWLINVHAFIMIAAWAVTAPAGALVGRYGRGIMPKWMKAHEILQGMVTPFLTIAGLTLVIIGMTMAKGSQFTGKHAIMGTVLIALLFVQMALGFWCHKKYDPLRKSRPARNWLHMILGMTLLGLAGATMYTGIELKGSATWMMLAFWVWTGTLLIAFAGGYALMPKQMAKEKSDAKKRRFHAGTAISSPITEKSMKSNPYGHLNG